MKHFGVNNAVLFGFALLIAFSTFSGFFRLRSEFYIGTTLAFFLVSFLPSFHKTSIGSWGIVCFVLICVLSILINQPPSYFRVWERLLLFVNTLLAFTPLIVSRDLNENRIGLYEKLLSIMMAFSVASFFAYFLGVNFFIRNDEVLAYNEAGHFSGVTNHSMVLAPVSAMGGIYALTKALLNDHNKGKRKLLWWGITIACFGALLLSASRGALGGALLAIVIVIYRINKGRMIGFLKYALIAVSILIILFPLWGDLAQYVVAKNDYNISQGGVAYSRETKMAARLYEIRNNFWTGVGFSTVDEAVDFVDHARGTIEPNSSWLGVFSMTGVFGFSVFLGIFLHAFYTAIKRIKDSFWSVLLCGILGFFFVHLIIEGYVLAAGSFLCGTYWLTIGAVYACSNQLYKLSIGQS